VTNQHPKPLPVVIIGGYLGAGKTTLLNHLLHHAQGLRIAVLVNDFGSINIDAELLTAAASGSDAGVISLAGGCLCCSFGDDLVGTLQALQLRQPPPDVVLIELSGVALPAAVGRTARLAQGIKLVGSLVLADAHDIRQRAADPYVGETVSQQLQQADGLLLNKAGLVAQALGKAAAAQVLSDTEAWLAGLAPQAPCLTLEATDLPAAWVWDWCLSGHGPLSHAPTAGNAAATDDATQALATFTNRGFGKQSAHGDARFVALTLPLPPGIDLHRLGSALSQNDLGVLRAKGMARSAADTWDLLQVTPGRWQVSAVKACSSGELVVIGLQQHLRESEIRHCVKSCVDQQAALPSVS
jgi:G3E family GTPase